MKQLKFMLAAATAIGLATAAQADVNTYLVGTGADAKENFNDAELGAAATSLTGYSYAGATAADNESVVVTNGYNGTQSLQVNTGTDPIVRDMNADLGVDIDMTAEGFKSLTIDTMVQFTVTPAGDTVTPGATDKLMIYLQEDLTEGAEATNLVVVATEFMPDYDDEDGEFQKGRCNTNAYSVVYTDGTVVSVDPGAWYQLTVKAAVFQGEPMFEIYIGGKQIKPKDTLLNINGTTEAERNLFPALTVGASNTSLRYVGFAGEGMVDDLLVFRTDEGETSVDFTLALGENVSAVSWTVGGVEQDSLTYSAAAGSTYDVVIKSVTYVPGYAGSKAWAGWKSTVTASTTVTIDGAEKFADVTKDDEGNVTAVIPNETTVTGVTTGSFQVPTDGNESAVAAAKAELGKVLTWATSVGRMSYGQAIAAVNKMNFDEYGNPAVVGEDNDVADEEAFLLNCAPAELAAAKEAFSFPSFTPGEIPQATEGDFNGKVTLKGATALGSWFDVIKEQGDNYGKIFNGATYEVPSFFKSVLTLK